MMREAIRVPSPLPPDREKLRSKDRAPRSIHSSAFDVVIVSLDVSIERIGKSGG